MLIEMVYSSNFWLNSFPTDDGVTPVLSPRAIVVSLELNYAKHCQLEFGTYVQTHEEHNNSMASRTTGAIALHPTGNNQGSYYFYSLTTGHRLNHNCWTQLPIPNNVIDHIHNLTCQGHTNLGLLFMDRHGHPFINEDVGDASDSDDDTYDPDDDNSTDDNDDNDEASDSDDLPIAGVNDEEFNEAEINNNDEFNKKGTNKDVENAKNVNIRHEVAHPENPENIENPEIPNIKIAHSTKDIANNNNNDKEHTNEAQDDDGNNGPMVTTVIEDDDNNQP
jgi:hypothetical protein